MDQMIFRDPFQPKPFYDYTHNTSQFAQSHRAGNPFQYNTTRIAYGFAPSFSLNALHPLHNYDRKKTTNCPWNWVCLDQKFDGLLALACFKKIPHNNLPKVLQPLALTCLSRTCSSILLDTSTVLANISTPEVMRSSR